MIQPSNQHTALPPILLFIARSKSKRLVPNVVCMMQDTTTLGPTFKARLLDDEDDHNIKVYQALETAPIPDSVIVLLTFANKL